ncbi:hypothetical protein ACFWC5_36380 [Streptomyces sp. NPDC060085]|uniref:hypothetical protein n=1 Tax=Streptomyces sp. NPDC060085 TaxID=3347054 RepID=UPI00364C4313
MKRSIIAAVTALLAVTGVLAVDSGSASAATNSPTPYGETLCSPWKSLNTGVAGQKFRACVWQDKPWQYDSWDPAFEGKVEGFVQFMNESGALLWTKDWGPRVKLSGDSKFDQTYKECQKESTGNYGLFEKVLWSPGDLHDKYMTSGALAGYALMKCGTSLIVDEDYRSHASAVGFVTAYNYFTNKWIVNTVESPHLVA